MVIRYNRRWDEMDKSHTELHALLKSYALYNRSEGRAASTICWYDGKLRGFLRWLEDRGLQPDLAAFTRERVREFILYLQEKEEKHERNPFRSTIKERLSGHTVRGYVRALKAFSSWLHGEGYTDGNILAGYRLSKARQIEHEWLRPDEVERLLGIQSQNDDRLPGLRHHADAARYRPALRRIVHSGAGQGRPGPR